MEFPLTYRSAGVDLHKGEEVAARAKRLMAAARRPEVLEGLADFGGLFALREGKRQPVLVASADGVGTKLKLAQALGAHREVGVDLVAMCVNDVLTHGAEPLFFLDYVAAGRLEEEALGALFEGIARGCQEAGCALLGGETAEMPDCYPPGSYDLAGFAVGWVERERLVDGSALRAGDLLLGLPSSGLHSNGFSLIRRIFPESEWGEPAPVPELGCPLGEELLRPTRIYARPLLALAGRGLLAGAAHITGGGIPGNLSRILPAGLAAELGAGSWPVPPIFRLAARRGPVEEKEMLRVFNLGLGMVLAVHPERAGEAEEALRAAGEVFYRVGEVRPFGGPTRAEGEEPSVHRTVVVRGSLGLGQ
ncbi:MAG: phosphoribosylformylglycinamidine cyclo-ligase [Nitrospinota bacterium]